MNYGERRHISKTSRVRRPQTPASTEACHIPVPFIRILHKNPYHEWLIPSNQILKNDKMLIYSQTIAFNRIHWLSVHRVCFLENSLILSLSLLNITIFVTSPLARNYVSGLRMYFIE
jgi:hypothetical protein